MRTFSALLCTSVTIASVENCFLGSSSTANAPEISPVAGGSSPSQGDLPSLPVATTSNVCGHSHYYKGTGNPNPGSSGIVGGITAAPNEYPWLVRLKVSRGDGTSDLCGASLINSQWLITAAHCVIGKSESAISAIFGDWDKTKVESGEYQMKVSLVKVHEQYSASLNDYDFALLKLKFEVPLTDWKVQAICLPDSCNHGCGQDTTAYITGWGTSSEDGKTASRYLQKAYVKIANQESCKTNYEKAGNSITDRMICAGWANGGVDSCLGDSGGPLMVAEDGYYKLCGITSFGIGCARVGYYGVYSRVCAVVPWVKNVLSKYA